MPITKPLAWENSGVHAGVVVGHTSMVYGSIFEKSSAERITPAVAVTRPRLTTLLPAVACGEI
jgi:hypothetical protein